ncbi:glycosyltransferase family 4 protein [Flavobacterium sp.]|jgi:glycosyltransferase involved in cell wall biosynthesis|uniref:glycosyltransferase family 4 protein n=1 Tax=Flavobacterium sp. TaxID=239 RepID=UPI0037BFE698
MGVNQQKIAVLCNYELLPERVGGMDYFYWMFDAKCKEQGIEIDWFFPNLSNHGGYSKLNLHSSSNKNVENYFLENHSNNQYSHVITHFIELCTPFYKKLKKINSSKIIAIDHNPRPLSGYPLKKRLEKKTKGILYAKYIDLFVGVSEYSKNQLIKELGSFIKDRIKVVCNGIEIQKFKVKTDFSVSNKFLTASHLRKDKGIQDVIYAVAALKKESNVPFTIDVYGEGPYETDLKNLVDEFDLGKTIIFKGSISNLHEVYSEYSYLVHPSHGETFCYTVVEALLSNLPVITTNDQGNVLKMVKENSNGFLFDVGDSSKLKMILLSILNGKKAILNGLEKEPEVLQFSLEKMVDNHIKLLQ